MYHKQRKPQPHLLYVPILKRKVITKTIQAPIFILARIDPARIIRVIAEKAYLKNTVGGGWVERLVGFKKSWETRQQDQVCPIMEVAYDEMTSGMPRACNKA